MTGAPREAVDLEPPTAGPVRGLFAGRWDRLGRAAFRTDGGGASPAATDSGSDESPMRWPARVLADHATTALLAIPRRATLTQRAVRRFTIRST